MLYEKIVAQINWIEQKEFISTPNMSEEGKIFQQQIKIPIEGLSNAFDSNGHHGDYNNKKNPCLLGLDIKYRNNLHIVLVGIIFTE